MRRLEESAHLDDDELSFSHDHLGSEEAIYGDYSAPAGSQAAAAAAKSKTSYDRYVRGYEGTTQRRAAAYAIDMVDSEDDLWSDLYPKLQILKPADLEKEVRTLRAQRSPTAVIRGRGSTDTFTVSVKAFQNPLRVMAYKHAMRIRKLEQEARRMSSYATAVPMVVSYQVTVHDATIQAAVKYQLQAIANSPENSIGTRLTNALLTSHGIDTSADLQVRWSVSTPALAYVYVVSTSTSTTTRQWTTTDEPTTKTPAEDDELLSSTSMTFIIVGSVVLGIICLGLGIMLYQKRKLARAEQYATQVEAARVTRLKAVHREHGQVFTHGSSHLPNVADREFPDGTQYWGQMNALLMKHGK